MADSPTSIGGHRQDFPSTCWSTIRGARDRKAPAYLDAVNVLCTLYWKPIYAYVRASRGYSNEEGKDLTQEFLIELVEGDLLARFAPDRGNFRSYLRGALHLFLLERHREDSALKRGGGRTITSLSNEETDLVDRLIAGSGETAEVLFERQWARSVLDLAVVDLRTELEGSGKGTYFRVFDRHQLNPPPGGPPSHDSLAVEFSLQPSDVNNYLFHCRTRLRDLVATRILEYVGGPDEVADELSKLFH